jgi:TonB family protein
MKKYYPFLASFFVHSLLIAGGIVGYSSWRSGKLPSQTPTTVYTVYYSMENTQPSHNEPAVNRDTAASKQAIEKSPLKKNVAPKIAPKEPENHGKPDDLSGGNEADLIPLAGNIMPTYPHWARESGLEGRFKLTLTIDDEGMVQNIEDSEASEDLYKLVEEIKSTIKRWRFKRSQKGIKTLTVPFEFVLT